MILVALVGLAFTVLHCLHYWLIDQPRERQQAALYAALNRRQLERRALDDPPSSQ